MTRPRQATILALLGVAALAMSGCLAHHQGPLPGEPPDARFMQTRGARIRYVDTQTPGPTVVLIHGFAASSDTWAAVRPILAKKFRVVALDLKGFGWSDRPAGDYSPQEQARTILAVLDELQIKDFAIVGHSWGSSVVLAAALQAPERVRRVALYDAWIYEEQLPTFFLWARASALGEALFALFYKEQPGLKITEAFYDKRFVTQALVEDVAQTLDRPGTVAAALAAVRGQRYEYVQQRYGELSQPVLLLWGREDAVTPLWVGERLASQLPHARLVVYPRCGHFPMIEAFAASTRELERFLAQDLATRSSDQEPEGRHDAIKPLNPGEVVP